MDPQLEAAAERAYNAFFHAAPAVYTPSLILVSWEQLPDVVKNCWRHAAAAAREN